MQQKEVLNSGLCEISTRLGSRFVLNILRRSQFLLHLFLAHIDRDLLHLFHVIYDSVKKNFRSKSLNQQEMLRNLNIEKRFVVERFGFNALRAIIPGCRNKQYTPEVVYACAVFRFLDILESRDNVTHYKTVLGVVYIVAAIGEHTPLYEHWTAYTNRYPCSL